MSFFAYEKYVNTRAKLTSKLEVARYETSPLQGKSVPLKYLAMTALLQEHLKAVPNSLNEYREAIHSLKAWEEIFSGLGAEEKTKLLLESVGPIAVTALNYPYVYKSRIIYSTAHLAHQANQSKPGSWEDDMVLDSEIYSAIMEERSKGWKKFGKLKTSIEKIGNKAHRTETSDFRNMYQHRISPNIEEGLTGLVKRNAGKAGVSYTFGAQNPIKLGEICDISVRQHELCIAAYKKYMSLVKELTDAVINDI